MAHASQTCSSSVRQQIMNLSGCDHFTKIRWKGNTSHGSYGLTVPKHQVLCRAVRSDFLPTDHGGCMRGIVPVSCVSGCETSPPVSHMPLASAKHLHANPQYGHKLRKKMWEHGEFCCVWADRGFFIYSITCSHHRDRIQDDVSSQWVHPRRACLHHHFTKNNNIKENSSTRN